MICMDNHIKVLQDIGKYKFLTCSQLSRLNVDMKRKGLYKLLKELREPERNFIDRQTYRYNPKYWRVEDVHYLLPKGKEYLITHNKEQYEHIKSSKHKTLFYEDYHHRTSLVDLHISLYEMCQKNGLEIKWLESYFERGSTNSNNRRETATKLKLDKSFIISDSIFLIEDKGFKRLFCLELHNWQRAKKICDQMITYTDILSEGIVSKKYWEECPSIVLIVFEHLSTLKTCVERLRALSKFDRMRKYFLCNTIHNLKEKPDTFWVSLDGEKVFLSDVIST